MGIWENDSGSPIVDSTGAIIECDDHPCEPCDPCDNCVDAESFYTSYSESAIELNVVDNAFFCSGCNVFNGPYALDYIADPSALDDTSGYLTGPFVIAVFMYEFPVPVTTPCPLTSPPAVMTHVYHRIICGGGQLAHYIGLRWVSPSSANPNFMDLARKIVSPGDGACRRIDSVPPFSAGGCTAASDIPYELN